MQLSSGERSKTIDSMRGSLSSIAPEIIGKKTYSFFSDIYALGSISYKLGHFFEPFDKVPGTRDEILLKVKNGERSRIEDHCPISFSQLTNLCWFQDPAKRATTEALCKNIEAFIEKAESTSTRSLSA
jgi:serine/threonine protein kinase